MAIKLSVTTVDEALSSSKHPTQVGAFDIPAAQMETPVSGGKLAFEAGVEGAVELFNDDNDEDAQGLYGKPPEKEDPANPPPPLSFSKGRAFLKYSAAARGKASGETGFPYLKASGSGEARVVVADYHLHQGDEKLRVAATSEVLRFPTRAADVLLLRVGEAMTVQARLALKASVEMSWSDVFSTHLAALGALSAVGSLITLQLTPKATVTGKVSIEDNFAVTFLRRTAGKITLLVRRARSDDRSVAANVGVEVGLSDDTVTSVLEAALGDRGTAAGLTAALKAGGLDATKLALAKKVLGQFGVTVPASDEEVEKQLEALLKKATQAAQAKLSAGFGYEYSRVREDATLFEVSVTDEKFAAEIHPNALSARVDRVLEAISPDELVKYFRQEKVKTVSGWGFSLTFGEKQRLENNDKVSVECVAQYASTDKANGPRRFAYGQPVPRYQGKLGEQESGYTADVKAEMKTYLTRPTAADFEYGLHLATWSSGGSGRGYAAGSVDDATVWEVFSGAHRGEAFERLEALQGSMSARLELKVPHATLLRLLPEMAKAAHEPFARALAYATPWVESAPKLRRDRERRLQVYFELWKAYLDQRGIDWNEAKARREAAYQVRRLNIGPVNSAEWKFENDGGALSFADVLAKNGKSGSPLWLTGIYEDWKQITSAAGQLISGYTLRTEVPLDFTHYFIPHELWRFQESFGTSFLLRAVGAWLFELARPLGIDHEIERTLTVTVKPAHGDEQKLLFGESR